MIQKSQINELIKDYDKDDITVGTIGSHSALNILKGAEEQGLNSLCICTKDSKITYESFEVGDDILTVSSYHEILNKEIIEKLKQKNTILIPHGSFNAYLREKVLDLSLPIFGNRSLLTWETDREKQRKWLNQADIKLPETYEDPSKITSPVIVKFPGAKGGRGYFLANSEESYHEKAQKMIKKGLIKEKELEKAHIQDYIIGVNAYPHFFRSKAEEELELLGMDRRYESTVDSMGKIPAQEQLEINPNPTYTVVGNFPVTARESLLSEIIEMGKRVVKTSEEITDPGIVGPFCLETVFTEDLEIYTFEISARIVAGTNVEIPNSSYSYIKHGEKMYAGKRIAKEIIDCKNSNKLSEILS
ncbi:5-formaminoimidazole-4-carboxamide-1-(beta)-D-ribofuranosyl 5'-monophosphate synthetase [archaeon SCG-AAA382B04]|nr:5-formaminoimidazole-4-carboxamide-1-(beta)-D-ribofuranosyl 5'-monophosphate synthetase [archaeon SCG-AAA382B04]